MCPGRELGHCVFRLSQFFVFLSRIRYLSVILCSRCLFFFFFSSRRRHTIFKCDWSSDVCSSDLVVPREGAAVSLSADRLVREAARLDSGLSQAGQGERLERGDVREGSRDSESRSEERRVGKEGRSRWSAYH